MNKRIKITFHYSMAYNGMDFFDSVEKVWKDFFNISDFFDYLESFKNYLNENYGTSHCDKKKSNCYASVQFHVENLIEEEKLSNRLIIAELLYHNVDDIIYNKNIVEKLYDMICEKEVK